MESRLGMRRDPCSVCGLPVFLAEKLVINRTLYHRTCFRCARCNNQLTPGNYYETEEGQYCCETCPDEESLAISNINKTYSEAFIEGKKVSHNLSLIDDQTQNSDEITNVYQKSLSDEEKSEKVGLSTFIDNESPRSSQRESSIRKMRLFIESHLLSDKLDNISVVDEPKTLSQSSSFNESESSSLLNERSASPDNLTCNSCKEYDESNDRKMDIVNTAGIRSRTFENECLNAISSLDEDKDLQVKENTKDLLCKTATFNTSSLVQQRLRLFQGHDNGDGMLKKNCREIVIGKDYSRLLNRKKREELEHLESNERRNSLKLEEKLRSRELVELKESSSVLKKFSDIFKDSLEPRESSKILDDGVAKSLETIEPLSPLDKKDVRIVDVVLKKSINKEQQAHLTSNNVEKKCDLSITEEMNSSNTGDKYPEALNPFAEEEMSEEIEENQTNIRRVSSNPFDSGDDEEYREVISTPQSLKRNIIIANKREEIEKSSVKQCQRVSEINLNPFVSDDESEFELTYKSISTSDLPIPKPRTIKQDESVVLSEKVDLKRSSFYASNSSIGSCGSSSTPGGGTYRKKKPAPQPPIKVTPSSDLNATSQTPKGTSPRTTPRRLRKLKSAPPPPPPPPTPPPPSPPPPPPASIITSTPQSESAAARILSFNESSITELERNNEIREVNMWEDQKSSKDEMNRNRQSLTNIENPVSYKTFTDKSIQGKWKRKKGPAPPCPVLHRRKIKVISMKDIKLELDEIEMQQQGLEKQGVRLEQIIRERTESRTLEEGSDVNSRIADVNELVLELFTLVNEKNELFRRQAELMLLRRQQRLEEEHADVEYQIRCLMCQPEATKTDFDKQREEALIQRLVQIVERRNEIIECFEMDRVRENEEDRSINTRLYEVKNKLDGSDNDANNTFKMKKKGKLKEKLKEKKLRKSRKKDADKDVDETEMKLKRHTKRKWF